MRDSIRQTAGEISGPTPNRRAFLFAAPVAAAAAVAASPQPEVAASMTEQRDAYEERRCKMRREMDNLPAVREIQTILEDLRDAQSRLDDWLETIDDREGCEAFVEHFLDRDNNRDDLSVLRRVVDLTIDLVQCDPIFMPPIPGISRRA